MSCHLSCDLAQHHKTSCWLVRSCPLCCCAQSWMCTLPSCDPDCKQAQTDPWQQAVSVPAAPQSPWSSESSLLGSRRGQVVSTVAHIICACAYRGVTLAGGAITHTQLSWRPRTSTAVCHSNSPAPALLAACAPRLHPARPQALGGQRLNLQQSSEAAAPAVARPALGAGVSVTPAQQPAPLESATMPEQTPTPPVPAAASAGTRSQPALPAGGDAANNNSDNDRALRVCSLRLRRCAG